MNTTETELVNKIKDTESSLKELRKELDDIYELVSKKYKGRYVKIHNFVNDNGLPFYRAELTDDGKSELTKYKLTYDRCQEDYIDCRHPLSGNKCAICGKYEFGMSSMCTGLNYFACCRKHADFLSVVERIS